MARIHVLGGGGPIPTPARFGSSFVAEALHAQPYLDCLAYRLDSSEGSVVFTSDTAPCEPVTDLARDADVMLCMCWDDQEVMDANWEGAVPAAPPARREWPRNPASKS